MSSNNYSDFSKKEKIPESIGGYKILEVIASGGMGRVYKAESLENGQFFAIKQLLNPEESTNEDWKRFMQEARLAQTLEHPNIVRVPDWGIDSNNLYLVMEYVEGISLSKILEEQKLDLEKILEIIYNILMGLDYAHSKGIIHRDIKPSNIILNTERKPLIMDFGLAKNLFLPKKALHKWGKFWELFNTCLQNKH